MVKFWDEFHKKKREGAAHKPPALEGSSGLSFGVGAVHVGAGDGDGPLVAVAAPRAHTTMMQGVGPPSDRSGTPMQPQLQREGVHGEIAPLQAAAATLTLQAAGAGDAAAIMAIAASGNAIQPHTDPAGSAGVAAGCAGWSPNLQLSDAAAAAAAMLAAADALGAAGHEKPHGAGPPGGLGGPLAVARCAGADAPVTALPAAAEARMPPQVEGYGLQGAFAATGLGHPCPAAAAAAWHNACAVAPSIAVPLHQWQDQVLVQQEVILGTAGPGAAPDAAAAMTKTTALAAVVAASAAPSAVGDEMKAETDCLQQQGACADPSTSFSSARSYSASDGNHPLPSAGFLFEPAQQQQQHELRVQAAVLARAAVGEDAPRARSEAVRGLLAAEQVALQRDLQRREALQAELARRERELLVARRELLGCEHAVARRGHAVACLQAELQELELERGVGTAQQQDGAATCHEDKTEGELDLQLGSSTRSPVTLSNQEEQQQQQQHPEDTGQLQACGDSQLGAGACAPQSAMPAAGTAGCEPAAAGLPGVPVGADAAGPARPKQRKEAAAAGRGGGFLQRRQLAAPSASGAQQAPPLQPMSQQEQQQEQRQQRPCRLSANKCSSSGSTGAGAGAHAAHGGPAAVLQPAQSPEAAPALCRQVAADREDNPLVPTLRGADGGGNGGGDGGGNGPQERALKRRCVQQSAEPTPVQHEPPGSAGNGPGERQQPGRAPCTAPCDLLLLQRPARRRLTSAAAGHAGGNASPRDCLLGTRPARRAAVAAAAAIAAINAAEELPGQSMGPSSRGERGRQSSHPAARKTHSNRGASDCACSDDGALGADADIDDTAADGSGFRSARAGRKRRRSSSSDSYTAPRRRPKTKPAGRTETVAEQQLAVSDANLGLGLGGAGAGGFRRRGRRSAGCSNAPLQQGQLPCSGQGAERRRRLGAGHTPHGAAAAAAAASEGDDTEADAAGDSDPEAEPEPHAGPRGAGAGRRRGGASGRGRGGLKLRRQAVRVQPAAQQRKKGKRNKDAPALRRAVEAQHPAPEDAVCIEGFMYERTPYQQLLLEDGMCYAPPAPGVLYHGMVMEKELRAFHPDTWRSLRAAGVALGGWELCVNKACHKCQLPHIPVLCEWCGLASLCDSCQRDHHPDLTPSEHRAKCVKCRGRCSCTRCFQAQKNRVDRLFTTLDQRKAFAEYNLRLLGQALRAYWEVEDAELRLEGPARQQGAGAGPSVGAAGCDLLALECVAPRSKAKDRARVLCDMCATSITGLLRCCSSCKKDVCLWCCQALRSATPRSAAQPRRGAQAHAGAGPGALPCPFACREKRGMLLLRRAVPANWGPPLRAFRRDYGTPAQAAASGEPEAKLFWDPGLLSPAGEAQPSVPPAPGAPLPLSRVPPAMPLGAVAQLASSSPPEMQHQHQPPEEREGGGRTAGPQPPTAAGPGPSSLAAAAAAAGRGTSTASKDRPCPGGGAEPSPWVRSLTEQELFAMIEEAGLKRCRLGVAPPPKGHVAAWGQWELPAEDVRVATTQGDRHLFTPHASALSEGHPRRRAYLLLAQWRWMQPEPVIVRGCVGDESLWTPEAFRAAVEAGVKEATARRAADKRANRSKFDPSRHDAEQLLDKPMSVLDCSAGFEAVQGMDAATFFALYARPWHPVHQPRMLKLKDYPPAGELHNILLEHYRDFLQSLPLPHMTRPDEAPLNLATCTAPFAKATDLGPKAYIALGTRREHEEGEVDSVTKLHQDMSDAVNVMNHCQAYPGEPPATVRCGDDEVPRYDPNAARPWAHDYGGAGAVWSIWPPTMKQGLRSYLRAHVDEFTHKGRLLSASDVDDPIFEQAFMVTMRHRHALSQARHGVWDWHFEQYQHEAVFIPAGCPHQVRNLRACIKTAVDFVSSVALRECMEMAQALRAMPRDPFAGDYSAGEDAHADKLQGLLIMLSAAVDHYRTLHPTSLAHAPPRGTPQDPSVEEAIRAARQGAAAGGGTGADGAGSGDA